MPRNISPSSPRSTPLASDSPGPSPPALLTSVAVRVRRHQGEKMGRGEGGSEGRGSVGSARLLVVCSVNQGLIRRRHTVLGFSFCYSHSAHLALVFRFVVSSFAL